MEIISVQNLIATFILKTLYDFFYSNTYILRFGTDRNDFLQLHIHTRFCVGVELALHLSLVYDYDVFNITCMHHRKEYKA